MLVPTNQLIMIFIAALVEKISQTEVSCDYYEESTNKHKGAQGLVSLTWGDLAFLQPFTDPQSAVCTNLVFGKQST